MKKIFIILFVTILTGWLVFAGLYNMDWNVKWHNSGKWQNGENSCVINGSNKNKCMMEGKSRWHGMQNMSEEEKKERFHHMITMKEKHSAELSQDLVEIIELADKIDYDTSKLKEYQTQLENLKKEYSKFSGDIDEDMKMMCANKKKWRWTNRNMRELMKKISAEFENIKKLKK